MSNHDDANAAIDVSTLDANEPNFALLLATGTDALELEAGDGSDGADGEPKNFVIRKQDWFLEAYTPNGDVRLGCQAAGVSMRTYARWVHDDIHGFRERFGTAHDVFCARLESKLHDLIWDLKPGQNAMPLAMALNAEMPEKYRPNMQPSDNTASDILKRIMSIKATRTATTDGPTTESLEATLEPPEHP